MKDRGCGKCGMRLKEARIKNKELFDKKHRLHPKPIEKGDWVLIYDNSLDNEYSAPRKVVKRWLGLYKVRDVNDNATFFLDELDGTQLRLCIVGKHIKLFKRRDSSDPYMDQEISNEKEDIA